MKNITIEEHEGILVLRDDLLPGGTKSVLMPKLIGDAAEYVYATPVYGAFQIALANYCKSKGIKATIFCARRKNKHPNTITAKQAGATIVEVDHGYLSVVEKKAKDHCERTGAVKLVFGAKTPEAIKIISERCKAVIKEIGKEPDEIWCAVGSGTLVEGILAATKTAKVFGVVVGIDYKNDHPRLNLIKYRKPFDKVSNYKAPFPSMANYDLKAWEMCDTLSKSENCLFWNVC